MVRCGHGAHTAARRCGMARAQRYGVCFRLLLTFMVFGWAAAPAVRGRRVAVSRADGDDAPRLDARRQLRRVFLGEGVHHDPSRPGPRAGRPGRPPRSSSGRAPTPRPTSPPPHKGAAGAYNEIVGDFDGKLGSGATGWVVIDSGEPGKGFKSYDWHTTIRAYAKGWSKDHTGETFSANGFDRWRFSRHLRHRQRRRAVLRPGRQGRAVHGRRRGLRRHRPGVRRRRGQLPVAAGRADHVPPLPPVRAGLVGRHGRRVPPRREQGDAGAARRGAGGLHGRQPAVRRQEQQLRLPHRSRASA